MTPVLSWGSTSWGVWVKCQPSVVRVSVQTTSNRSSGHSSGGAGETDGKSSTISGIPPCCHEISVEPGWARTSLTSFFSDRKSTRLNSSHVEISYAVFCLKKKKKKKKKTIHIKSYTIND